jgi:epoxyqueuosine reductase
MRLIADEVKAYAQALGFNLAGVAQAVASPTLGAYLRWLEQGMHADMAFMARPDRVARRKDLNVILPGALTLIVVGMDYHQAADSAWLNDPMNGRFAAYAWGMDYHHVMESRLKDFAAWLERYGQHSQAIYVDTGAVLERSHAERAGLGFIGKNTMLIHPRRGSAFFLGEILTTLACDAYDEPLQGVGCGTCTRCFSACPTDAFPRPYVLDARRCISYHTIENKGAIPADLRPQFGNWVYGCDVCQDVCPWQRFAPHTHERQFWLAQRERAATPLATLLALTPDEFSQRYRGTPIHRAKLWRLQRNACVAAGNSGQRALVPALEPLAASEDDVLAEHARWALERLAT